MMERNAALLSIDKLTIVGLTSEPDEVRHLVDEVLSGSGHPVPRWKELSVYSHFFRLPRIGAVFLGHRFPRAETPSGMFLGSVDFNPNLADMDTVKRLLALFGEPKVTRIDVAVDLIHADASKWLAFERRLRQTHNHEDRSRRFGTGDRKLLVYSKIRERTDKNRRAIRVVDAFGELHELDAICLQRQGLDWLRVEARLSHRWIQDNHPKPSAFDDLFVLPSLDSITEVPTSLPASRFVSAMGVAVSPVAYGDLSVPTKRSVRRDLRVIEQTSLPVASPAETYQRYHQDFCDLIDRLLSIDDVA